MTNSKTLIISSFTFILVSFTFQINSFAENETSNFSNYDFIGKVNVVDGDTIKRGKIKIRLHGIDAPESKQTCKTRKQKIYPCGYKSTAFLKSLIKNKDVICYGKNKDRYGRLIAVCFSENLNLNSTMVKEGWAIAYRYYSKDYVKDEETARKLKKGIWQGTFIEPYSWRKNKN